MVRIVGLYIMAQVIGAFAGVAAAHLMFEASVYFLFQNILEVVLRSGGVNSSPPSAYSPSSLAATTVVHQSLRLPLVHTAYYFFRFVQ